MISKNFFWFIVLSISLISLIINTMYENWKITILMMVCIVVAYKYYINNRVLGQ
jgi:1,4-dihydroxy-2-naphthoate octaprenyltransferase